MYHVHCSCIQENSGRYSGIHGGKVNKATHGFVACTSRCLWLHLLPIHPMLRISPPHGGLIGPSLSKKQARLRNEKDIIEQICMSALHYGSTLKRSPLHDTCLQRRRANAGVHASFDGVAETLTDIPTTGSSEPAKL